LMHFVNYDSRARFVHQQHVRYETIQYDRILCI